MADWVAAIAAILSALLALGSLFVAQRALIVSKEIAKQQHVLGFFSDWQGARQLDPARFDDATYLVDIVNAANLLSKTSVFWEHEIIDRRIIAKEFWPAFDSLYQSLAGRETAIEQLGKSGAELVAGRLTSVHEEMKETYKSLN
jgi:hypothetical protein